MMDLERNALGAERDGRALEDSRRVAARWRTAWLGAMVLPIASWWLPEPLRWRFWEALRYVFPVLLFVMTVGVVIAQVRSARMPGPREGPSEPGAVRWARCERVASYFQAAWYATVGLLLLLVWLPDAVIRGSVPALGTLLLFTVAGVTGGWIVTMLISAAHSRPEACPREGRKRLKARFLRIGIVELAGCPIIVTLILMPSFSPGVRRLLWLLLGLSLPSSGFFFVMAYIAHKKYKAEGGAPDGSCGGN